MNNIQPSLTSSCLNPIKKPIETTVSEQQPNIIKQTYENFKIINNNDSRFYVTRNLKVEKITFKLK